MPCKAQSWRDGKTAGRLCEGKAEQLFGYFKISKISKKVMAAEHERILMRSP